MRLCLLTVAWLLYAQGVSVKKDLCSSSLSSSSSSQLPPFPDRLVPWSAVSNALTHAISPVVNDDALKTFSSDGVNFTTLSQLLTSSVSLLILSIVGGSVSLLGCLLAFCFLQEKDNILVSERERRLRKRTSKYLPTALSGVMCIFALCSVLVLAHSSSIFDQNTEFLPESVKAQLKGLRDELSAFSCDPSNALRAMAKQMVENTKKQVILLPSVVADKLSINQDVVESAKQLDIDELAEKSVGVGRQATRVRQFLTQVSKNLSDTVKEHVSMLETALESLPTGLEKMQEMGQSLTRILVDVDVKSESILEHVNTKMKSISTRGIDSIGSVEFARDDQIRREVDFAVRNINEAIDSFDEPAEFYLSARVWFTRLVYFGIFLSALLALASAAVLFLIVFDYREYIQPLFTVGVLILAGVCVPTTLTIISMLPSATVHSLCERVSPDDHYAALGVFQNSLNPDSRDAGDVFRRCEAGATISEALGVTDSIRNSTSLDLDRHLLLLQSAVHDILHYERVAFDLDAVRTLIEEITNATKTFEACKLRVFVLKQSKKPWLHHLHSHNEQSSDINKTAVFEHEMTLKRMSKHLTYISASLDDVLFTVQKLSDALRSVNEKKDHIAHESIDAIRVANAVTDRNISVKLSPPLPCSLNIHYDNIRTLGCGSLREPLGAIWSSMGLTALSYILMGLVAIVVARYHSQQPRSVRPLLDEDVEDTFVSDPSSIEYHSLPTVTVGWRD